MIFNRLTKIIPPVAADLISLCLYFILFPKIIHIMNMDGIRTAAVISSAYIIFCISVVIIRKLPGKRESSLIRQKGWLAFFGMAFGIFITYMIAESSGFFHWLDTVSSSQGEVPALTLFFGTLIWFAFVFLYTGTIIFNIQPSSSNTHFRFAILKFFSLLGINVMIVITIAYWNSFFMDTAPYENLAFGGKILIFVGTYLFFLFFFAAPRMIFLLRNPGRAAYFTFFLQTAIYVWDFLSRIAWT